jgi:catechol 2,3-dioxygenase-like lactoylglutathione lyase family enzyme
MRTGTRPSSVAGVQQNSRQGEFGRAVPILRITSVEDAYDFYLGVLGMTIDWEHRFEPGLPVYVQVSRSGMVLHLSEHAGDGAPGGAVWIAVEDVRALRDELLERLDTDGSVSEIDRDAPGGPTFEAVDPFDNRLRFAEPAED